MADSIGTQMGNLNGENFRMNYINVNHLVRLYDAITNTTLSDQVQALEHSLRALCGEIARNSNEGRGGRGGQDGCDERRRANGCRINNIGLMVAPAKRRTHH